jgi:hypothetical protein
MCMPSPQQLRQWFSQVIRFLANTNLWLALFTGLLVVVAGLQTCILSRTDTAMHDAAQAEIQSAQAAKDANALNTTVQRSWVSIFPIPDVVKPLHFTEQDASVTLDASFRNTGHTPAIKVTVHSGFFVTKLMPDPRPRQREICDEIRSRPFSSFEIGQFVLFPGDVRKLYVPIVMSKKDIDDALAQWPVEQRFIQPTIVGCVDYFFPWAEEHHQTAFAYDLRRISNTVIGGLAIFPDQGDIPPHELMLLDNMFPSDRTD